MTSPRRLDPHRAPGPPVPRVPAEFHTPVRGHAFAARPVGATAPAAGADAVLVREPRNPADAHAVAVWVGGRGQRWRIGYLDRAVAARLAPRLDAGARLDATVTGWTAEPEGRWQRPVLRVRAVGEPPGELPTDGLFGRPPGSRRRRVTGP